jgi:hypothetical protein
MSWIEERLKQQEEARARRTTIAQYAERIYAELWEAIVESVKEAQGLGIEIATNGSPLERTVMRPVIPKHDSWISTTPKELKISLKKDKQIIAITGITPSINLDFDLCADGRVCLKLDGAEINYSAAAQAILEPFLFP